MKNLKNRVSGVLSMVSARRLAVSLVLSSALVVSTSIVFITNYQSTLASRIQINTEQELLSGSFDISAVEKSQTNWQNRLYAPTHVTKINGMWFIVDSMHNRVIWSKDLFAPISQWNTVDGDLAGPHTIAYGAGYYAVEDTNRHSVNFYAFDTSHQAFVKRSTINLGSRPHRIHFDEQSQSFYVLSSFSQDMHRISVKNGELALANTQNLPFLEGQYTRSFNIVGDQMLFTSGAKKVAVTSFRDDQYNLQASYVVPPDFYGMNDIYFTGKKYIVTATLPNAFGVVDKLEDLAVMKNEANTYGFKGRPYYVSQFGSAVIIPEIAEYTSVKIFELDEGHNLLPQTTVHEFGEPIQASVAESFRIPMAQR